MNTATNDAWFRIVARGVPLRRRALRSRRGRTSWNCLRRELPKYGGNLCRLKTNRRPSRWRFGASYAGSRRGDGFKRSGISLKTEAWAGPVMAENARLVIVDVQRGGLQPEMPTNIGAVRLNIASSRRPWRFAARLSLRRERRRLFLHGD